MTQDEFYLYAACKVKVVQEVLTWLVADIAYFKFHNSTNYKNALTQIRNRTVIGGRKIGNYHLKKMTSLFNFDKRFITLLCGGRCLVTEEDGKIARRRIAGLVLDKVKSSSRYIKYIGKRDCKTKSGSRFSHLGWWKLTDEGIAKVFESGELLDKKSSDFYCEESKFIISKIAFHYARLKIKNLDALEKKNNEDKEKKNNNEENMTKAEKEKLKKECDEGKHGLAYEYLVKQAEKKEKQNLKTLHTRIVNLTQKAMFEIVEENKSLKAKIEQLAAENKEFRNLNSDIPKEEEKKEEKKEEDHKLSFDEYCDLFNACDDPATFYIPEDRLSEECKRRCLEEEEKERRMLVEDDQFIDRYLASIGEDGNSRIAKKLHEERTKWCQEHGIDPDDKHAVAKADGIEKKPAVITPPDDIPEESDDKDDGVSSKLKAIGHALDEIKSQKKSPVKPPEDDIPEAPEEKHYSKVIPRLQEFVNKCYISKREAERFAAIAKEKIPIKESRTGFSSQDRQKNKKARETIMQVFVKEYKDMMDDKDWKWVKMFTI